MAHYDDSSTPPQLKEDTVWNLIWGSLWNKETKQRKARRKPKGVIMQGRACKTTVEHLSGTMSTGALLLGLWDNIFGPRIEHVWIGADDISDEVQLAVARHSLSGELGEEEERMNNRIDTKFHVFADLGYLVTACIFTGKLRNSVAKYSFCLLMRIEHLSRYLLLHKVVEDRMHQLVASIKAIMTREWETDLLETLRPLLGEFVTNVEALYASNLAIPSCLSAQRVAPTFVGLQGETSWLGYDLLFLQKIVTSHLLTRGRTVIAGKDLHTVNSFVDSLAIFLRKEDIELSSHAQPGRTYVPDLILQGLLTGEDGNGVKEDEMIWACGPSTLVDLDARTVRQAYAPQYLNLRREYMNSLLHQIHAQSTASIKYPWHQDGLLRPFNDVSPFVTNLLLEVWRQPLGVRHGFIGQTMRALTRKVAVLIAYTEGELQLQHRRERYALSKLSAADAGTVGPPPSSELVTQQRAGGGGVVAVGPELASSGSVALASSKIAVQPVADVPQLEPGVVRRMKTHLGLEDETDFLLCLAHAQHLCPNIYLALLGDPAALEEKLRGLFESF